MIEKSAGSNEVYPEQWDEFIGQDLARRELRLRVKEAIKLDRPFPHTLVVTPFAGMGKTALLRLIALELQRPVRRVSGVLDEAAAEILFARVKPGTVVIYDEFHRAVESGEKRIAWMLDYLVDGTLVTTSTGQRKVPAVTFLAATTDKGRLRSTITSRFTVVELNPYSDQESALIARQLASKVLVSCGLPQISDDLAGRIARAASNQPRLICNLLERLRTLAVTDEILAPANGDYSLSEVLEFAHHTPDGLTQDAQNYLRVLLLEARNVPAGEKFLKDRLGLVGTGLFQVEQLLFDKGLLMPTKQGRKLTSPGIDRAVELFPEAD